MCAGRGVRLVSEGAACRSRVCDLLAVAGRTGFELASYTGLIK